MTPEGTARQIRCRGHRRRGRRAERRSCPGVGAAGGNRAGRRLSPQCPCLWRAQLPDARRHATRRAAGRRPARRSSSPGGCWYRPAWPTSCPAYRACASSGAATLCTARTARGIRVVTGLVERLDTADGRLAGVHMRDGRVIARTVMVVAPRMAARSQILSSLGLHPVPHPLGTAVGELVESDPNGRTAPRRPGGPSSGPVAVTRQEPEPQPSPSLFIRNLF